MNSPILTDEAYERLRQAYSTGFKMVIAVCPRCGWDRGFFFFRNGRVGFDPGCFCTGRTGVKFSGREFIEKYLRYHPEAYQQWLDAADEWNARLAEMEIDRQNYKVYLQELQKKIEEKKQKPKTLF